MKHKSGDSALLGLVIDTVASLGLLSKGPVRGIDFHKQQPLFVSGGDDYKIKVSLFCLYSTKDST